MQVRLVVVEHDQLRRLEAGDLAAQLAADGAAGAGDQHPLAGDHLPRRGLTTCISSRPMRGTMLQDRAGRCRRSRAAARRGTAAGGGRSRPTPTRSPPSCVHRARGRDGIAITTTSALVSRRTSPRSSSLPSTGRPGTPLTGLGRRRGSRSGSSPNSGTPLRSRASARPASPAPTIRVRSWIAPCRWSACRPLPRQAGRARPPSRSCSSVARPGRRRRRSATGTAAARAAGRTAGRRRAGRPAAAR